MKLRVLLVFSVVVMLSFVLQAIGPRKVAADIPLWGDKLTVTGFYRLTLAVHTGVSNPANSTVQDDNNRINLFNSLFQTEWTFKPWPNVKLYSKIRLSGDLTDQVDSDLADYNAYPLDHPGNGTLMKADGNNGAIEAWELWGDFEIGNLWLRLGRQQIVWGEMIAARFLDIINPLDYSWHFIMEPEEFENIRVPNWAIRATYSFEKPILGIQNPAIEVFVNPGDFVPQTFPDLGAPYNLVPPFPPFFNFDEKDNRGKAQYGIRLMGGIRNFYATLNYLLVYDQEFALNTTSVRLFPFTFNINKEYPKIDVYGLTFNFYIEPLFTVVSFEGTYTPSKPYGDARALLPEIRDKGTCKYAIKFDRKTRVFGPRREYMDISLQFSQTILEGDEDDVLLQNAKADKTVENITFQIMQDFFRDNLSFYFRFVYDTDDAYWVYPKVTFRRGVHWYFDLAGSFFGGSEKRPGRLGSLDWANEVFCRITYQF